MKNPFKTLALKALDVVRNYSARDPELYHLGGFEPSSGMLVTADKAMQHEAVWSCVRIIAICAHRTVAS
jgi:phage portal protein BeeE